LRSRVHLFNFFTLFERTDIFFRVMYFFYWTCLKVWVKNGNMQSTIHDMVYGRYPVIFLLYIHTGGKVPVIIVFLRSFIFKDLCLSKDTLF
jgi:hypothetical protein